MATQYIYNSPSPEVSSNFLKCNMRRLAMFLYCSHVTLIFVQHAGLTGLSLLSIGTIVRLVVAIRHVCGRGIGSSSKLMSGVSTLIMDLLSN